MIDKPLKLDKDELQVNAILKEMEIMSGLLKNVTKVILYTRYLAILILTALITYVSGGSKITSFLIDQYHYIHPHVENQALNSNILYFILLLPIFFGILEALYHDWQISNMYRLYELDKALHERFLKDIVTKEYIFKRKPGEDFREKIINLLGTPSFMIPYSLIIIGVSLAVYLLTQDEIQRIISIIFIIFSFLFFILSFLIVEENKVKEWLTNRSFTCRLHKAQSLFLILIGIIIFFLFFIYYQIILVLIHLIWEEILIIFSLMREKFLILIFLMFLSILIFLFLSLSYIMKLCLNSKLKRFDEKFAKLENNMNNFSDLSCILENLSEFNNTKAWIATKKMINCRFEISYENRKRKGKSENSQNPQESNDIKTAMKEDKKFFNIIIFLPLVKILTKDYYYKEWLDLVSELIRIKTDSKCYQISKCLPFIKKYIEYGTSDSKYFNYCEAEIKFKKFLKRHYIIGKEKDVEFLETFFSKLTNIKDLEKNEKCLKEKEKLISDVRDFLKGKGYSEDQSDTIIKKILEKKIIPGI